MDAPLKGIRVIDWTIWQTGPVATTMLADMGAEVIKIEERDKGDPGRSIFAIGGSAATAKSRFTTFISRRTIANKAKPHAQPRQARGARNRLSTHRESDVFVQNPKGSPIPRPWVQGIVRAQSEARLCSSSGYGPSGPDSGEPSFDTLPNRDRES